MSARAMWKGVVHLGPHRIPVRMYPAARDSTIRFRLLHREDLQPVEQRMVHPETGREVPAGGLRRGAEFERGAFVLLEDRELASLDPEPSRAITVERIVSPERIHPGWYDRPYHLGPDGDPKAYGSLVALLEDGPREAVVRWVMRKKEHVGALLAHEGFLALATLRFAEEVVDPAEIEVPPPPDLKPEEIRMARELIGALDRRFDPSEFHDRFAGEVRSLIALKARGRKIPLRKMKPKAEPESLEQALKASLAAVKRRKHA